MSTVTVERIAKEYQRLLEEGWKPEVEEFLHHVPQPLRPDCRKRIQELTGAPAATKAAEPRPAKAPPSGPQRMSREEAKRMFREMEARRKPAARA
jgi:hypothetical protein